MKQVLFISFLLLCNHLNSQEESTIIADTCSNPMNVTIENILPKKSIDNFGKIIPILTLVLGFFMGKIYEYWQQRRQIKRDGMIWFETYIQLSEPLEKQISNISALIDANPVKLEKIVKPELNMSLECQDFEFLNNNALIPYLRSNFNIDYSLAVKLAGRMKNTVRSLSSTSIMFKDSFDDLNVNSKIYQETFANELQSFRKLNADFIVEINQHDNPSENEKKFANIIDELTRKFINLNVPLTGEIIFKISNVFFREYLEACYTFMLIDKLANARDHLTRCDIAIQKMINEREVLMAKQKHIRESYERSFETIKGIQSELGKTI